MLCSCLCWLQILMWSREKQAGCYPLTWSSPGLGLMKRRSGGSEERETFSFFNFPSDKVLHCCKAINVDSVSQWVMSAAVTDSASVYACACASASRALLRSYQKTMGRVWTGLSGRGKGNRERKVTYTPSLSAQQKKWGTGPLMCKR